MIEAYRSSSSSGIGDWLEHVILRGVIYRLIFALPLWLDVLIGALVLLLILRRHHARRQ